MKNKNIVIVHYNTPELTLALIKSVRKNTPGCHFYIFDNSQALPFIPDNNTDITIIDNTSHNIINFKEIYKKYKNYKINKTKKIILDGSIQHILAVDYFFDYGLDDFVLLDSDVIIKHDISCFFDKTYIACGQLRKDELREPGIHEEHYLNRQRFFPFILYINVEMCKKYNIRFCHRTKLYFFDFLNHNYIYDTGASFLEDILISKAPFKKMQIKNYINHLGKGSPKKRGPLRTDDEIKMFLEKNKKYYE